MSNNSKISWTDATWQVSTGCSPAGAGCLNCYAIRNSWRLAHNPSTKISERYRGTVERHVNGCLRWTGDINLLPDQLTVPLRWRNPRLVFVDSLSDLFHPKVTTEYLDMVFGIMHACRYLGKDAHPGHVFQLLTKRPKRMHSYLDGDRIEQWAKWATHFGGAYDPDGLYDMVAYGGVHPRIWTGFSAANQHDFDKGIDDLFATNSAVRWLSLEPLVGPIELTLRDEDALDELAIDSRGDDNVSCEQCGGDGCVEYMDCPECWGEDSPSEENHLVVCPDCGGHGTSRWWRQQVHDHSIQWVVVGAESGPGARTCDIEWVYSIVRQCQDAQVPVFNKQIQINGRSSRNQEEWPEDLRVQEYPK